MSAPVTEKLSVCVQQFSGAEDPTRAYEQGGQKLSCFDLNNRLPALKEEHPCSRRSTPGPSGVQTRIPPRLHPFLPGEEGLPRFDSRKTRCSPFRYRSVRFPQIGEVKAIFHRIFTGKMKYATVSNLKQGNGLSASLSMMGSLIRNLRRSLRTPPLVSIRAEGLCNHPLLQGED